MLTPQNRLLCGVLFLGLLVLDQISKTWVVGTFDLGQRVDVTPFFRLTLEYNEGIGLSMFSFLYDWIQGGSQLVFGVVNIVISGFILYFARNEERRLALVGWTLVLAGRSETLIALSRWGLSGQALLISSGCIGQARLIFRSLILPTLPLRSGSSWS